MKIKINDSMTYFNIQVCNCLGAQGFVPDAFLRVRSTPMASPAPEYLGFGARRLGCVRGVSMAVPSISCRRRGGSGGEIWRGTAVTHDAVRSEGESLAATRSLAGSTIEKDPRQVPRL